MYVCMLYTWYGAMVSSTNFSVIVLTSSGFKLRSRVDGIAK